MCKFSFGIATGVAGMVVGSVIFVGGVMTGLVLSDWIHTDREDDYTYKKKYAPDYRYYGKYLKEEDKQEGEEENE